MSIADRLNQAGVFPEHDSRVTPLAVKDPDGPSWSCKWVATSAAPKLDPEFHHLRIKEVTEMADEDGLMTVVVYGDDGTVAHWDDFEQKWKDGEPE